MKEGSFIAKIVFFILIILFLYSSYKTYMYVKDGLHDSKVQDYNEEIRYCEVDPDCVTQSYQGSNCWFSEGCFNKNEQPLSYKHSMKILCEKMAILCCKCENGKCTAKFHYDECINTAEDCEKMKEQRDYCYFNLVKSSENRSLCYKINGEKLKEKCLAQTAEKTEDCGRLTSTSLQWDCYYNLAIKLKDPTICTKMRHISPTVNAVEYCIRESTTSPETCKKLGDWEDTCYMEWALEYSQPEYCEKSEGHKIECYRELSIKLNDLDLCKKSGGSYCYQIIAKRLKDPSICDNIKEESIKKYCIYLSTS